MFQHTVVVTETQYLIKKAERCSSSPSQDENVFTDIDQGFYVILGSLNGRLAMNMLIDHKQDIVRPALC